MTEYIEVAPGNSLFLFLEKRLWLAPPSINDRAIHRLCSLMRKMRVQTAIVEDFAVLPPHVQEEKSALDKYFGENLNAKIFRVTFSDRKISSDGDLYQPDVANSFLSTAIIVNVHIPAGINIPGVGKVKGDKWHSYVYVAAVAVPFRDRRGPRRAYLLNNYLHVSRTIEGEFLRSSGEPYRYRFCGTYFLQKSVYTSVCAQAALCMMLNSSGLAGPDFITPERINRIAGIDHTQKKFLATDPAQAASFEKTGIEAVLNDFGLHVVSMDFFENPNEDYVEYLYPYFESRCPTMLVFRTERESHIVPLFGHTLNTDMWAPEAEIAYRRSLFSGQASRVRSTSAWVDHLVIHDDNLGMYHCLPVESLRRVTLPQRDPHFRALYGFAVVPDKLESSGRRCAQSAGLIVKRWIDLCRQIGLSTSFWLEKMAQSMNDEWHSPFVTRTTLASRDDFARSLKLPDFEGNRLSSYDRRVLKRRLPEKFWLVEVSLPDLYTANKTKVADILFRCDIPFNDDDLRTSLIQARFADWFISYADQSGQPAIRNLGATSHYPLLCLDEECRPQEW